jgi:hypothetical protein
MTETEPDDAALSGTVLAGLPPLDDSGYEPTDYVPVGYVPPDYGHPGSGSDGASADDYSRDEYGGTAGLVYEAPNAFPAYLRAPSYLPEEEPVDDVADEQPYDEAPADERPADDFPAAGDDEPVANEGVGIFGDIPSVPVPDDDDDDVAAGLGGAGRRNTGVDDGPPANVIPIGTSWNQSSATPNAVDEGQPDRNTGTFGKIRKRYSAERRDRAEVPQVRVRDLPPDVQMSFLRDRTIIVLVVGIVSFIFVRSWPLSVTLMIIAFVLDMVRRQRTANLYVNGGAHPGARKATTKQLRRMQRAGYFTLDARPIPDSREVIDHLVVGPTGVYAIDSEKWNPKLPIRTWNGKKLYHGPESQKPRLEHAVWEASQAQELLSSALGYEVKVRPAIAIYGPKVPWGFATIRGVDVFTGPALSKYLRSKWRRREDQPIPLTAAQVKTLYNAATRVLPDVADAYAPVGGAR